MTIDMPVPLLVVGIIVTVVVVCGSLATLLADLPGAIRCCRSCRVQAWIFAVLGIGSWLFLAGLAASVFDAMTRGA